MKTKVCSKCGRKAFLSEFNKSKGAPRGIRSYCKTCQSEYSKRRYREKGTLWNTEYQKKKREEYLEGWKDYFTKKYGKTVACQICGKSLSFFSKNKDDTVFFDHRKGKETLIDKSPSHFFGKNKVTERSINLVEGENFGILCWKCNIQIPTDLELRKKIKEYLS